MNILKRKKENKFVLDEKLAELNQIQFSFRDGFSNRLTARLENMLDVDPSIDFLRGLSSLLPRLITISSIIIILFILGMIVINGEINLEAFLGSPSVNENNFIGYLILE